MIRYNCIDDDNKEVQIWLPIPLPPPKAICQPIRRAGPTRLTNQID